MHRALVGQEMLVEGKEERPGEDGAPEISGPEGMR